MRRILKITVALATLALGFTVAAIGGTAQPASATFCIQWDAHAARGGDASTATLDAASTLEEASTLDEPVADYQLAIGPLPDPEPSVICLVLRSKVVVQHG
jgi:hypothetical protein